MRQRGKQIYYILPSLGMGGAEAVAMNQIRFLLKKDLNVNLILLSGKVRDNLYKINLPANAILELNFSSSIVTVRAILEIIRSSFKLRKFVEPESTLIAHLPISHIAARFIKLFLCKSIKIINYHHSLQFSASPLDSLSKKVFNKINSWFAFMVDDKNFFVSQASYLDNKKNFFIRNPYIIPNGIITHQIDRSLGDELLTLYNVEKRRYKIFFPGRLQPTKGHTFFLKTYKRFIENNGLKASDIILIILGEGSERQHILTVVEDLNLNDYVAIYNYVDNLTVLSLYKSCELTVIPSKFEGFGNVAIEAMMQGATILASHTGGLKEIIENSKSGYFFKVMNHGDLLDKLNYIYLNWPKTKLNSKEVSAYFENNFTFEKHISKLMNYAQI